MAKRTISLFLLNTLKGSGLSVIDRWLNERIKDKAMLFDCWPQIDPVVTNNTAEAAVALLLATA
ncbi:hypothetical protein LNQ52_27085 [Klebsiella pneumoniae subsp. pneumoniae]|nr:hypothetical protein [Klebsiella pneumoniae subsp. pneumoniae]